MGELGQSPHLPRCWDPVWICGAFGLFWLNHQLSPSLRQSQRRQKVFYGSDHRCFLYFSDGSIRVLNDQGCVLTTEDSLNLKALQSQLSDAGFLLNAPGNQEAGAMKR